MNEKTMIHHLRRQFRPGFGEAVAADLVAEAKRLRAEQGDLAASAVLLRWRGENPTTTARLVHHPAGAEAPIALVAGRHSQCDLGRIPGASLRHALLLFWPPVQPWGRPSLEAIDLGTETGIALVDGRLAARFQSSEPIRFGVASADVVVLHARAREPLSFDPAVLSETLRTVPEQAEVTLHTNQDHTRHLDVSGIVEPDDATYDQGKSCVELNVEALHDGDVGSEHDMLTQFVRFREGLVSARIRVRLQDLERGVRLGRYLRCRGATVLRGDEHVSRVHALVLERGGRRWLFDTASTNGTSVFDVDTGVARGPVRGERTFVLMEGEAPKLAGQVAFLEVGTPDAPS